MSLIRSGLFAAWTSAWLDGRVSYDDVVDRVVADESHRVLGLPGTDAGVPVGWALTALRAAGERTLQLVLPVPGDPRGLPGPGQFSTAAIDAGEGVVGSTLGFVPREDATGVVSWMAHEISSRGNEYVDLSDADHDLAVALRTATKALVDLDVASWRQEAIDLPRHPIGDAGHLLPPGTPTRAVGLLDRATRLTAVLEMATADATGGAVTAVEASARDMALRPLATAVRRAQLAAYNAAAGAS